MFNRSSPKIRMYMSMVREINKKMFVTNVNSKLKQMTTNVVGVKLWNNLPSEIIDSSSLCVFKSKLKYEYISNY